MTDTARRYQAGYRDPVSNEWVVGVVDVDSEGDVEIGYYDVVVEDWFAGVPDILSGDWMPVDAVIGTGEHDCPPEFAIKGNLPSRVYHTPEQPSYDRTIPEICFTSEDAATSAGFRAAHPGSHGA